MDNDTKSGMKILENIRPDRLQKLFHRLVDIYSPSGKEEDVLDYLYAYLRKRNFPVKKQEVDDNRYNLVLSPPEMDIQLFLLGHLDTVPAYDLDHYQAEQRGDIVSGLGTADMKGGCAAMIEAFVTLWEEGHHRVPAALALVVGEEEDGDGARALLRDYRSNWAVIGEPTDLTPCLSTYGYMELKVSAKGKRMHASLSKHVRNPIESMLQLILRLTRHMDQKRPDLVYNIRDLWSSQAGFAVPEFCEGSFDIHMKPSEKIPEIMGELEDLSFRENIENDSIDVGLRFVTVDPGFELPEKGPVVASLKESFKRQSLPWKTASFISHSDANQLWQAGVRPIVFGPGQLEKAHTPDESVSMTQVCRAAEMYYEIMKSAL